MCKCTACGRARFWALADGRFKCKACGHRQRDELSAWDSVWLSDAQKRQLIERFVLGVPIYRQRFRPVCGANTAEKVYRLLRACCAYAEQWREPFTGALECDETTFGGARHGPRGWGALGKVIVFGIIKRNGQGKAMPIATHDRQAVMQQIDAHTREGSLYYTDQWQAYATLKLRGDHVVIRKEKGRPVGRDHINGIEGFWSYAKNWLYPYRGVPSKYFHLYLGEVCYRFNHRSEDLQTLLYKLLRDTPISKLTPLLVQK